MADQHHNDVGPLDGLPASGQPHVGPPSQRRRKRVGTRLSHQDPGVGRTGGHLLGDRECGRLAQIVDVGLEGQAEHRHSRRDQSFQRLKDAPDVVGGPGVVDLASRADEPGLLGRGGDQEPWVHGDAVATHPGPRVQDAHPRMAVGQVDELPDVHPGPVADEGQLVGEGDIEVTEGVLRQLGHLGGGGVGENQLAPAEGGVQIPGQMRGLGGQPTDDPGVGHHLGHDASGQHSFGTVGDMHPMASAAAVQ